ncbi:MAG: HAD family hydrolase [Anaerostipes sp.]|nr:HAD family hydrolase [Anaerostipes sp.]
MKQYKGIVFFDYDGTTVDEVDRIKTATPKTKEALERLQKNDYLTMLCSGRTRRFLEVDIDSFEGAITCNGSYTQVGDSVIRDVVVPDEILFDVIDRYFPRDTIIQMDTQAVTYYLHSDAEFFKYFNRLFNLPDEWYAPWKYREKDNHINKLVLNYKTPDVFEDFKQEYKDVFTVAKHVRENFFDITLKGVTKGDAVKELVEHLDIPIENTYAFGDADNDVEMMETVGTGIAMGRHSDAVGKVANMVTGTVKEEGIFQALEKLELI